MIDVLTVTREGRLAVVELKADEDIHPLQGLDYWSRVARHHARGEFQRFGYFLGRELSRERPLLFLVAPGSMCILPQILCCTPSHEKSSGWWWALMSVGAMESGRCFGSARVIWN